MAYGVISHRRLAAASDSDLYNFALNYARQHQFGDVTGVAGAGGAPGSPASFAAPARLELGRQGAGVALARRKALAASLARRTTESSRRRVLDRILAGYGATINPGQPVV